MDEPLAAPKPRKVLPAAPKPAPARPARSRAPSGPLVVDPVAESATHRALGRTVPSPRKRQRNNLLAVAVLSVMAIGLGIAGVVLLASKNEADNKSADDGKLAADEDGKQGSPQQPKNAGSDPDKRPETTGDQPGTGSSGSPDPRAPENRHWVDASKTAVHRDKVRVQVLSARIDTPPGEAAITRGEYLLITVQVQNNNPKDLRFTSWNSPVPLDEPVTLTDHTGKIYRQRIRPEDEDQDEESETPAPAIGSSSATGKVLGLSETSFESEVLRAQGLVLVNFFSPGCPYCKGYLPLVEQVAADNAGSVKVATVNINQNSKLAGEYEIDGVPTVVVFKDGEVVDKLRGTGPKSRLQDAVNRHSYVERAVYQPLRAAETIEDVLVFEPPEGEVKHLRLTLPAAAFGSKGTLDFLIPGKMFKTAKAPDGDPFASPKEKPDEPSPETPDSGQTQPKEPDLPEEKLDPGEEEFKKLFEEELSGDGKEGEGFESMPNKPSKPDPKKGDQRDEGRTERPGSKEGGSTDSGRSRPGPGDRDGKETNPFE